ATPAKQATEIATLAGGVAAILARRRALLDRGDATRRTHRAEWAARAEPENRDAQACKRDVYLRRLDEAESLMARGIFRASMHDAERALGEEPTHQGEAAGVALVGRRR